MIELKIREARLAFPDLFKPRAYKEGDTPKFGATFLLDPKSKDVKKIQDAMKEAAQNAWKEEAEETLEYLIKKDKVCLRDGNDEKYDGFPGMLYLSTGNTKRPTVVDRDKTQLDAQSSRPYAGCYVNANVKIWAQDNQYGKRVNAEIQGVQFVRDGDAFGGGTVSNMDDFDDLSVEDDDDLI